MMKEFWMRYHELGCTDVPPREVVQACDRNNPLDWNPIATFQQITGKSEASYTEQKLALQLI